MGLTMSLQERVRHHQRQIRRESDRVDREIARLRDERKPLCKRVKYHAERGEMIAFRSALKQLVQSDKQSAIYHRIKTNCEAMKYKLGQVHSTTVLQKTLRESVRVMATASSGASLQNVNQYVGKYMQKMEETDLKLELMDDAMAAASGDDEAEEELERRIMDELQIDLKQALPTVPQKSLQMNLPTTVRTPAPIPVNEPMMDPPVFRVPPTTTAKAKANNIKNKPEPPPEQVYDGVAEALHLRLMRLSK